MRDIIPSIFFFFFTLSTTVFAQQPPMTIISSWDFENVGAARRYIEKYQVPELDRLVEEGKILNWGYMQHYMADEYDIIYWYELNGIDDYWDITTEVASRIRKKATKEEMKVHSENIINHKDGIYAIRHRKAKN